MEAALIIGLSMLAYICWNILAIKDGIECTNARINNINITLAEHSKMLKELQPKKPIEIPARLSEDILKEIYNDEDMKELKEWDATLMDGLEDK